MTQPEDILRSEIADDAMSLSLEEELERELADAQRELREIDSMVVQSKSEVEKLAQRNATITMHLQQVEGQMDKLPPAEIQSAYEAALDAQQRLVGMRGQLEKLQSDHNTMQRYVNTLHKMLTYSGDGNDAGGVTIGAAKGKLATAEMLIQAQESERQKLSRRMHDGPAQTLSNFILQTEIAMRLFEIDQEKAREELNNLKGAASTAFQQVRDFIFDLRPMMLDDLGLVPTVKRYIEHFREKHKLDVTVQVTGSERRLESYLEVMFFRAVQELLNNIALHSQATAVNIVLDMGLDTIKLAIEDDGKGFDAESELEGDEAGLGIKLIRDRCEMLGGKFTIDSSIGNGARIVVELPAANME
jgi:two-component system sensor histidine kinase DegS